MARTPVTARHTLHVTGPTRAATAHNARPRKTAAELVAEARAHVDRALAIMAALDAPPDPEATGNTRHATGKPGTFSLPSESGTTPADTGTPFPAFPLPADTGTTPATPRRPTGGFQLPKEN